MREYCWVCRKQKDDFTWKRTQVQNEFVWICGLHFKPISTEFIPESTREERKKYAKSILQPWNKGEPSREFMESYPEQSKKMFTPNERRKAKYVFKDEKYLRNYKKAL